MSFTTKYKQKLRRLIGRREVVSPICDKIIYDDLSSSFTGGSLAHARVLWVINELEYGSFIETANTNENIWSSSIIDLKDREYALNKILDVEKNNVGPFEHIINIIRLKKSKNATYHIFNLLQQEEKYAKTLTGISSISTIIYFDDDMEVERETLSKFILGIARNVMLPHKVICNAVFTTQSIPTQDAFHAVLFMSSKYAYGLSGEILDLR